jgi:tetratricopeptide (TPR) repeat protein
VAAVALCLVVVAGTAVAMARHDAAARQNEQKLREEAEGLAATLEEKNGALERESEERVKNEVARQLAERDKRQTEEAFEKYVAAMLAGHRAFDDRRYGDAAKHFEEAADVLAGTNAAKVAESQRRKALDLQAAPPPSPPLTPDADKAEVVARLVKKGQDLLKAGKYAEAEDAALSALELGPKDPRPARDLQGKVRQEWRLADDRQRERDAFDALMNDGDKSFKKKEYDNALKAFGAAVRGAPDARSAADAADRWKEARAEADAESSKKLRDDLDKESKAKTDLLVKTAEYQGKAQCCMQLNLPGEGEAYCQQLSAFLTKQRTDAVVGDVAAKLLAANDRLLKDAKVQRGKAEKDYDTAMAAGKSLLEEGSRLHDPGRLATAIGKFADATGCSPTQKANQVARKMRFEALTALNEVLKSMPHPKPK